MNAQFRTVSKCQICILNEQGVLNPEEHVLPQYLQTDPTKPPIPLNAESADYLYDVFPDERPEEGQLIPRSGVMGTVRSVFSAIGFFKEMVQEAAKKVPKSRKIAEKKKRETLFD